MSDRADPPGRTQLLEAALRAVARSGTKGATVRSIAEEAGVTNGLIVHHFGTKERLFAEVDAIVLQRFRDAMAVPADGIAPSAATSAVSTHLSEVIGGDPHLRAYVRRSLLEATGLGRTLLQQLIETTSVLLGRLDGDRFRRPAERDWTATQIVAVNLAALLFEPVLDDTDAFSPATVRRRTEANRAFISAALGLPT